MTDIVSIIQRALFGSVDSQVLLTSDNYGYEVLDFALESNLEMLSLMALT